MKNDYHVTFGEHSYGDMRIIGGTFGRVTIGKYCSLGEGVMAYMSHDHNINNISSYPFGRKGMAISKLMKLPLPNKHRYSIQRQLKVAIGNDVFIGSHTIIFRGVTIGDGVAVGAFSKITKNIPPYSVVVGESRITRKRFSDEDIEFLLKLKWWNFTDQEVAEIGPILCSPDITALRVWAKWKGKYE
jgi:acetyltransferase-like isoleucine patch superfamily enzyme